MGVLYSCWYNHTTVKYKGICCLHKTTLASAIVLEQKTYPPPRNDSISFSNHYKFLDLGTGPATQAIWLAKRGFKVTGSDLSEAAVNRARKIYAKEKNVNFIIDDILNSTYRLYNLKTKRKV